MLSFPDFIFAIYSLVIWTTWPDSSITATEINLPPNVPNTDSKVALVSAAATPEIFPTPMVAASAVHFFNPALKQREEGDIQPVFDMGDLEYHCPDSKHKTCQQEMDQHNGAPDEIIQIIVDDCKHLCNIIEHTYSPFVTEYKSHKKT